MRQCSKTHHSHTKVDSSLWLITEAPPLAVVPGFVLFSFDSKTGAFSFAFRLFFHQNMRLCITATKQKSSPMPNMAVDIIAGVIFSSMRVKIITAENKKETWLWIVGKIHSVSHQRYRVFTFIPPLCSIQGMSTRKQRIWAIRREQVIILQRICKP